MTCVEQARAYARADFAAPHSAFIKLFQERFGEHLPGPCVLDLGCGPGDITFRFARAYPHCMVFGVDGSAAMLAEAQRALSAIPDLAGRIVFIPGTLPTLELPLPQYDVIISNSLLHHLPDPQVLWETIKCCAAPGAAVFVIDLLRPATSEEARRITQLYSHNEPEILQRDFYHSLCAAFELCEIEEQLTTAGIAGFTVKQVSDRHVMIAGHLR